MGRRMAPSDFRRMVQYDSAAANSLVDTISEYLDGRGSSPDWEMVANALGTVCSHMDTLVEREAELERIILHFGERGVIDAARQSRLIDTDAQDTP